MLLLRIQLARRAGSYESTTTGGFGSQGRLWPARRCSSMLRDTECRVFG